MIKIANHTAYHKAAARRLIEGLDRFSTEVDVTLTLEDNGIRLCSVLDNQKTCYDYAFDDPKLLTRARQKNQALLRACSNRKGSINRIADLTAGWGRDAFLLAAQGREVILIEHHRLIFHCLEYLLDIAADTTAGSITGRMQAINRDSVDFLNECEVGAFDCVYIDPMFPVHKSGAKPAKELQLLQRLTSNQSMQSLFEQALKIGAQRVVVKRPLNAPTLNAMTPSMSFRAKTIRFDVYLTG